MATQSNSRALLVTSAAVLLCACGNNATDVMTSKDGNYHLVFAGRRQRTT